MKESLNGNVNNENIELLLARYSNICQNINSSNTEIFIDAALKIKNSLEDLKTFLNSPKWKTKVDEFKQSTPEDISKHTTALQFDELNKKIFERIEVLIPTIEKIEPSFLTVRKAPSHPMVQEFRSMFEKNIVPELENLKRTLELIKKFINWRD